MGVYLSTPKTDKSSEDGENDSLRFGLSSMQGWRSTMEDAHAAVLDLDKGTCFFGVFDGHGGKAVARFCAKYLHAETMKHDAATGDLAESLKRSFFRMDEMMQGQRGWREIALLGDKMHKLSGMIETWIYSPKGGDSHNRVDDWAFEEEKKKTKLASDRCHQPGDSHNRVDDGAFEEGPHSDYPGPSEGSTACVAVIRNKQLTVGNAGDSRCVLSRNGQAIDMSKDHKPDLAVERERILEAGGFVHAGRVNGTLSLARAIGDMEFKHNKFLSAEKQIVTCNPDINVIDITDEDEFLVLACDGIWDCMTSQQLVDFIHEQLKTETRLSAVCEKVMDHCLAPPSSVHGEGCDNMTMVLVQFKKPDQSSPATSSS